MSEKKSFAARNEKKIESRFAKYPFGSAWGVCPITTKTAKDDWRRLNTAKDD